jgi:hypothetical protein
MECLSGWISNGGIIEVCGEIVRVCVVDEDVMGLKIIKLNSSN